MNQDLLDCKMNLDFAIFSICLMDLALWNCKMDLDLCGCFQLYHGSRSFVAQWVKYWPTDLAVQNLSPSSRQSLLNHKHGSIAHSLSISTLHRSDMSEIL